MVSARHQCILLCFFGPPLPTDSLLRFLLKYASRDEVDIFGQGTGGVSDMRAKMTEYDENSPLYGFLRYRRRNVLVKYLPEGCSRLIQGTCG